MNRFHISFSLTRCSLFLLSLLLFVPVVTHAKPFRYAPIEPHYDNVVAARFTPDGKRTVSLDDSGVLIEWDFINKRILRRVQSPFATESGALSGDIGKAVFLSKGGEVALYDLGSAKFQTVDFSILKSKDKEREASRIVISADAKTIFASDSQGRIYRSVDGKPFDVFTLAGVSDARQKFVSALAVSPDGKKLAIGEHGMIRIVDAVSGEPVWLIPHDSISYSISMVFSPDSSLLTAGVPGVITLDHSQLEQVFWRVDGGRKRLAVTSPDGVSSAGGFSRDGKLALLAFSSSAQLYDLASGKQLGNSFKATRKKAELYFKMDMTPDGRYLLISGRSGLLKVYETARIIADKEPQEFAALDSRVSKVEALTFSPDGKSILVSNEQSNPQVLDVKAQKMRERLECLHHISSFKFAADAKKVLAIGPYFISQWQWPSMATLPELEFKADTQTSDVEVSPDGASGVALANNELIGDGFYRLPVLQMLDLVGGKVTASFKLEHLKNQYARYFDLACVDYAAKTAVVLDNDGDRREGNGRRPNPGRLPNRALLYSLTDGALIKTLTAETDRNIPFDCAARTFAGTPRQFHAALDGGHHYNHIATDRFSITSEDGLVTVTDTRNGSIQHIETSGTGFTKWETGNHVVTMSMSPDGSTLAVGTNMGDVGLYDVKNGKWLGTYLYLGYKEWIWYTAAGIVNASKGGSELVRKVRADGK